jgi:DNA-binding MarR family transcriptional regulator
VAATARQPASRPSRSPARRVTTELAAVLHDLAWLLPRTVDPEAEAAAGLDPLPASELEVMRLLVRDPGLSVGSVARALGLQESNVSATVRALIARGLLERRRDPGDGRVARLHPTARAIDIHRRRERAWGAALGARLSELTAAERAALPEAVAVLRALAGRLGADT